jgi:hypothetical protein
VDSLVIINILFPNVLSVILLLKDRKGMEIDVNAVGTN